MVFYKIDSGQIRLCSDDRDEANDYVAFGDYEQMPEIFLSFGIEDRFLEVVDNCTLMKFESYGGLDFIYVYDILDSFDRGRRFWIFLRDRSLIFICDDADDFGADFLNILKKKSFGCLSVDRILAIFLNQLVLDDVGFVRALEEEIEDLEGSILSSKPMDANGKIISLRKRLLFLKHYYEQLLEVAWDIEENENGILGVGELKSFGLFSGRLERITKSIAMLRDYLTQVRESYDSAVDIRLNETMEFFTVITAIFLPLTLLTSWYGMNFKFMPELGFRYGYLGVFVVAIFIVVALLVYFRKKNMFR